MKNNLKKRSLIFSIILLILACLVFFLLNREVDKNNQLAEEKLAEWQTEFFRREEIKSLDRTIRDINNERNLIEIHFAKSSDVVPFLDTIEALAIPVGAEAEVSSVDIVEETSELLVSLKARGSFEALYKFLMLLENSPYELEFISMDLEKSISKDEKISILSWEIFLKMKLISFIQ